MFNVIEGSNSDAQLVFSVAGKRVQAAALYPLVMQYLPSLLPGHFTDLLGKGKGNEKQPTTQMTQAPQVAEEEEEEEEEEGEEEVDLSLLAKLEEMIKTDVWKLGFNYVRLQCVNLMHVGFSQFICIQTKACWEINKRIVLNLKVSQFLILTYLSYAAHV